MPSSPRGRVSGRSGSDSLLPVLPILFGTFESASGGRLLTNRLPSLAAASTSGGGSTFGFSAGLLTFLQNCGISIIEVYRMSRSQQSLRPLRVVMSLADSGLPWCFVEGGATIFLNCVYRNAEVQLQP